MKAVPPVGGEVQFGADLTVCRTALTLEMNPYCRRALATGLDWAQRFGGEVDVITMGPINAHDVLHEALAAGATRAFALTDVRFAGADSLATARILSAFLSPRRYDAVLLGRSSVDAETGQLPAQLAGLLDLPLVSGAARLEVAPEGAHLLRIVAEADDEDRWRMTAPLPAVISAAERLCSPVKVPAEQRARSLRSRIEVVTADDLTIASAPELSRTRVVAALSTPREERRQHRAPAQLQAQVDQIMALLADVPAKRGPDPQPVPDGRGSPTNEVVVIGEPWRPERLARLIGEAAALTDELDSSVRLVTCQPVPLAQVAGWGADQVDVLPIGFAQPSALAQWLSASMTEHTEAVLGTASWWGRQVLGRLSAIHDAGLVTDASHLTVEDGRILAVKPGGAGYGDALVEWTRSPALIGLAAGAGAIRSPRPSPTAALAPHHTPQPRPGQGQIEHLSRLDDVERLASADTILAIGAGVTSTGLATATRLATALGAELAGTRKVTDQGLLPRSRQVGVTGAQVSPQFYLGLGLSGQWNHLAAVQADRIVLVTDDPDAPGLEHCDLGVIARWQDLAPALLERLATHTAATH